MNVITSQQNSIYKLCGKLSVKKYRDSLGLYMIEGPNLMSEASCMGAVPEHVIVSRSSVGAYGNIFPTCTVFEDRLFSKISDTEHSQGIIGIMKKPDMTNRDRVTDILSSHQNVIILDRLQDPGNIGTIMRTADAAGFSCIIAVKGTGDIYSPKAVRAAAGSVFRVPAIFVDGGEEAVALMKEAGKRVYATCLDRGSRYYDEDLKCDSAIIIGNEGNGVSNELMARSDCLINIPMRGNTESLNAGIAAAILMYEAVRE